MTTADPQFEGVYGPYTITEQDRRDVQRYRLALLTSGLALLAGVVHCWVLGMAWAWLWMLPLGTGLGLALLWIHIYLRPLHRALQLFWLAGCLGWAGLLVIAGPTQALSTLAANPIWILAIGPLFAALAGIGFKEFFCFQRGEAIGLTLLLPLALLGRLLGLLSGEVCLALMALAAVLMVVLALRKFGMDAAADVGDKSVFAYLDGQLSTRPL
ncbi:MAG: DUF2301 domain-containing membrane protein [Cyanobacteria bacterium]|nr:hypothetical protein [Synechococcus sp. BS307-5m-G38]MDA0257723.1 DUF2301 domain-containing membrane protein [Cyanobacteriota bacterium]